MSELYGLNDELPPHLADVIVDEPKPVGAPNDENTADRDDEDDE